MLLTVSELYDRVQSGLSALVEELAELTGRGGENERYAWQRSLPRLAEALTSAGLGEVHVHFARREHHVALEYQLPGTSSWCDVVLLGRHGGQPSAVIIELKDWETNRDRPGVSEGLVERHGIQELHPSDQVRGYVEYCRNFHSAVLAKNAQVHGLVLFTTGLLKFPYLVAPNERLAANYPVFSMANEDVSDALPKYLGARIQESDEIFAAEFATGTFHQERGFMRQIGRTILDGDTSQFELLDNQRRAFHLCLAKAREAVADSSSAKRVILVEGPPGSGKSAVAARLWASLVTDLQTPGGNIVLVTTSQSQSSNWTYLIDQTAGNRVGRGIARKATSFSPIGIPQLNRIRRAVKQPSLYRSAKDWRSHLADLVTKEIHPQRGAEDDSCLVSLVDEAHALINTEREHGVGQYGFVTGLGPQAFHVIRCSRVAIFLMDPEQGFRSRENTTVDDIVSWAVEQGATVDTVSLHGVQFRCAGSAEYVAWVESLLSGESIETNRVYASAWHSSLSPLAERLRVSQSGNVIALPVRARLTTEQILVAANQGARYERSRARFVRSTMDFRVFRDPFEMEKELRKHADRYSVRLLSSYSRPWRTKDATYPHRLPPEALDFHETIEIDSGAVRTWSRPWNFVPGQDYTGFVTGRLGLPIHDDALCEVGCTYAVRGFDFDYVGLIWLDDLLWRGGKWVANLDNVHESGISVLVRQARREGSIAPAGPIGANVLAKLRQAYRILLTRSIRGIFAWIPDEETREYVLRSLEIE